MKKTIILLLTILTLKVAGQNNFIGINGGISFSNIYTDNKVVPHDTKFINTFTCALSYEHIFKNRFSIGADILYNRLGYKEYFYLASESQPDNPYNESISFYYDYISIPIKTGISIGNKIFGFLKIGIVPAYLVDAKVVIPPFDRYKENMSNVTSNVSKFNLGGLAEIGGGFKFSDRFNIISIIGYRQSFTSTITNSNYFAINQIQHYNLTFSIGLKYALSKK